MIYILSVMFLIFGLVIGSFLNVVILRFNTDKSFGGRSACMSCQSKLRWYELIPVFSFLFLKGRCGNCKSKISCQYPIVEILSGLIFLSLFFKFQDLFFFNIRVFAISYAYYATIFSLLLIITTYDVKHKVIPDILSVFFGILGFLGIFLFNDLNFEIHLPTLLQFFAGPIISAPFAFLWLISKGAWIGLGDAKLALGMGWVLGLSMALSGIVLSFWIGAIFGILLVVFSRKYKMKSELPFVPFLVLGTLLVFFLELHLF